jgi:hypothetical protein
LIKTFVLSVQLILITAAASIVYGFIVRRRFTLAYVFNANFIVGAIIVCIALVRMFLPARFKFDKLTDHTTFVERFLGDEHKSKQEKAYNFLYLGLLTIIITGLIQLALAVLIK